MSAQILGIADISDALRSERAYKPAFCHQKIFQILTAGDDRLDSAKHFFAESARDIQAASRGIRSNP